MTTVEIQFVNVFGQPVDTDKRVKRKASSRATADEWHRGFMVEGLAPDALSKARNATNRLCDEWADLDDDERASRLRSGEREPKAWDETKWRAEAKRQRIAKPFGVPEAADQCKELAERSGWIEVRVVELAKRNQQP